MLKKISTYLCLIIIWVVSYGVNTGYAADAECAIGFDSNSISSGEGTALWWWTNNARSATIDNGVGNVAVPSGWEWLYPTGSTRNFTLTVVGNDGIVVKCSAKITISASQVGPECAIGLDPDKIKKGEGTALWWWSAGALRGSIDNGVGTVKVPSDWLWVIPEKTTTYTLTLIGANGVFSKCSTTLTVEDVTPPSRKAPVMFIMDDPQYGWLENISVQIANVNINKSVDITLDVVPRDLHLSTVLGPKLKTWNTNNKDKVQIAMHGYHHNGDEYNMDTLSYSEQKEIIKNGVNELAKLGIVPTSFTPPGGAQNQTTLQVLAEYNFKTILDWWSGTTSTNDILVVKQSGVELCQGADQSGVNCIFKSPTTIMSEMDAEIATIGYTSLVFHMQDFATATGAKDTAKFAAYTNIINKLKAAGRYDFMTVEEYHDRVR